MSNSKKKTYKKREGAHVKAKVNVNVKKDSKTQKFLNDWLWLITLIVIVIIAALLVIFIPKCDSTCTSCYAKCASACDTGESDNVSSTDPIDPSQYTEQMNLPDDGEQYAVFETTMGTIKMRLFPEEAPKTVENFVGLINKGYYNNLIFNRVVAGFVDQAATDVGGISGESIWGGVFEDEFDGNDLYHFRGAVSMANTTAPNTNSSQFFIVQSKTIFGGHDSATLESYGLPEWVVRYYEQVGGTPSLDHIVGQKTNYNGHTVFAQVFEGLDVVDAINAVEVGANDRPVTDVVITKAYIDTYHNHPVDDVSSSDVQG